MRGLIKELPELYGVVKQGGLLHSFVPAEYIKELTYFICAPIATPIYLETPANIVFFQ